MQDLYHVDVSPSLLSKVTDVVNEEVEQWRDIPLEAVYPVVWLDGLVVKVHQDSRLHLTEYNITVQANRLKEEIAVNELEELRMKLEEVTRERDELRRETERLKKTPAHTTEAVEEWFERGFY